MDYWTECMTWRWTDCEMKFKVDVVSTRAWGCLPYQWLLLSRWLGQLNPNLENRSQRGSRPQSSEFHVYTNTMRWLENERDSSQLTGFIAEIFLHSTQQHFTFWQLFMIHTNCYSLYRLRDVQKPESISPALGLDLPTCTMKNDANITRPQ